MLYYKNLWISPTSLVGCCWRVAFEAEVYLEVEVGLEKQELTTIFLNSELYLMVLKVYH